MTIASSTRLDFEGVRPVIGTKNNETCYKENYPNNILRWRNLLEWLPFFKINIFISPYCPVYLSSFVYIHMDIYKWRKVNWTIWGNLDSRPLWILLVLIYACKIEGHCEKYRALSTEFERPSGITNRKFILIPCVTSYFCIKWQRDRVMHVREWFQFQAYSHNDCFQWKLTHR